MTDPPKKTRKNGKRGSTVGETIFKEEGKLVRPGRGLTPPLIPPYALLTEGKVKRAKRSGKRERKKQFVKRLEGEEKNLLIEKKRNKSC